jgi:hypothetical protein
VGIGNIISKVLTTAGLGQEDLLDVTKGCLDRINRMRSMTSQPEREAIAFSLGAMIDELRHRDVATNETADKMHEIIRAWLAAK